MEKTEILNIIVKHMRLNLDGLEDTEIDTSKSMTEYGASSLDMVEVVSSTMRELRIKVPRTKLANLKNMDELADTFIEHNDAGS